MLFIINISCIGRKTYKICPYVVTLQSCLSLKAYGPAGKPVWAFLMSVGKRLSDCASGKIMVLPYPRFG